LGRIKPALVAVGLDASGSSSEPLQQMEGAIIAAVRQPGRRFAIVAVRTDDATPAAAAAAEAAAATAALSVDTLQQQAAVSAACRCATALGLDDLSVSSAGTVAGCFPPVSLPVPAASDTPLDGSSGGLYIYSSSEEGEHSEQSEHSAQLGRRHGWSYLGAAEEEHGPLPCCEWRSTWGLPRPRPPPWVAESYGAEPPSAAAAALAAKTERAAAMDGAAAGTCSVATEPQRELHTLQREFDTTQLHALWTPASESVPYRGAVLICPGSGTGAGPVGSFGPFCLFSRLATQLAAAGVATLRVCYPAWASGKLSVSINALRECMQLLQQLVPATEPAEGSSSGDGGGGGVVLLGWSMGGAAVIEAAARLSSVPSPLPMAAAGAAELPELHVAGIITLASQAAGLLKLGNSHGRVSSLRTALRILARQAEDQGKAIPIVAMHGSRDACVRPDCTEKIADLWSAEGQTRKVVLEGDDHAVRSAFERVMETVDEMLAPPPL
jgi:hypothetical protein